MVYRMQAKILISLLLKIKKYIKRIYAIYLLLKFYNLIPYRSLFII